MLHILSVLTIGENTYQRDKQLTKIMKDKKVVQELEVFIKTLKNTPQSMNMATPLGGVDKQALIKEA